MEVNGTKPMSQLISSHSQTSTRKKQGIGKLVVKPHYFTPAEADIPAAVKNRNDPTIKHYPIPLNPDISLRKVLETQKNNPEFSSNGKCEIDGFYLLEAAKIDFPEDVQHLSITDKKLRSVVDEDLTYFTELFFLDVSENYLPFTPFGALPKLKELRIACNRIQKIDEIYGFNQLMYLDLSYNSLTSESILSLSVLPVLKELDLSGNCLTTLPSDMSNFTTLEKIILEYNKFDNNKLFQILGTMPNIRHIDLSHNYLSYIPRECCEYGGLRLLETLDIAFNYFSTEESIEAIVLLNRLVTIMLYGNPVLGPTGEHPMFIYIEELVDKASQIRQASGSSIADVEFITEMPRRRILKKGQPLGRFALYRDFSIVQVDPEKPVDESKTWKKRGISTPFTEAMNSRKGLQTTGSTTQIPDLTFITNSIAAGNVASMSMNRPSTTSAHVNALKESDTNAIADDVMKKIASEMGLIGVADLNLFEDYVNLPSTIADMQGQENTTDSTRPNRKKFDFITSTSELLMGREDDQAQMPEQVGEVSDHLPSALFVSSNMMTNQAMIPVQPIALKTAMKELQRALDQPLTNYDEVPSKWPGNANDYHRDTKASRLRQLPRIITNTNSNNNTNTSKTQRFGSVDVDNTPAVKQLQQENREKTLEQIDLVLDKLNQSTEQMTLSKGSNLISSQGASNKAQNVGVKQSLEKMRSFAKPQTSVKNLVDMVHNIIDEFNN